MGRADPSVAELSVSDDRLEQTQQHDDGHPESCKATVRPDLDAPDT